MLMRLLGFFTFWRSFIPNLSQRTYNLRKLTRKNADFVFTEECKKERTDIIEALRKAETLQPI
jgi:hypothetical protein